MQCASSAPGDYSTDPMGSLAQGCGGHSHREARSPWLPLSGSAGGGTFVSRAGGESPGWLKVPGVSGLSACCVSLCQGRPLEKERARQALPLEADSQAGEMARLKLFQ